MKSEIYNTFLLFILLIDTSIHVTAQTTPFHPINSIYSDDYSDLAFMDSIVQNKNIVFLGESYHGVEDFNKMKFRLIRYLHEYHDFNLVIFEAGVHEVALTNIVKDSLTSLEMLTRALMGFWRTESNCKMLKYIRDNHIDIAGMDFVSHALPPDKKLYNAIYDNSHLANRFFLLDSLFYFDYRMKRQDFFQNNKDGVLLDESLDSLAQYLIDNYKRTIAELKQKQSTNQKLLRWANNAIVEEIKETRKVPSGYYSGYSPFRDSTMALNLRYAIDSIYPNEKTIVWAHDFHISKTGDNQNSLSTGIFLGNSILDHSVVISLSAVNGTYTLGYNPPYRIKLKKTNLEKQYKDIKTKGVFVSADDLDLRKGINSVGVLRADSIQNCFDGFVFLKDVEGSHLIRHGEPNDCE